MVYVFLTVLIGLLVYLIITFKKNNSFQKKELIILSCIAIFALCGIAYCIEPGKTTDLYAHFQTIKNFANKGFFIQTSVDNILVIKVLFYLISLVDNYHLLSLITVLIVYVVYFVMFIKFHDSNKLNKVNSIHFLILFFALCNFYYISTGIKTGIAYSLLAFSIYLIENNKKKLGYCLMGISLLCHGSVIILIILYFLNKVELFKKNRFWLLLIFLGARIAGFVLIKIPIPLIEYVGEKINLYINRSTISLNLIVLMTEIIFALMLLFRCQKIINEEKNSSNLKTIYYIQSIVLLGLGTILVSDIILERMLMIISFFIPILVIYENGNNKRERRQLFIFDLVCSIILIGYFFVRLINHVSFL